MINYASVPLLIIFTAISCRIFAGGPWLISKRSGFIQIQSTIPVGQYTRLFLENNKDLDLNRAVLDLTLQAYLEYGITDKLNVITSIPYKFISTGKEQDKLANPILLPKGNLNGLGNYEFALKYKIIDKKLKAALSMQSCFNTTSKNLGKGLITGYDANTIGLYIHVGGSFSEKLYSFFEGGFNTQTNDFSDFIELHYEIGYQLKPSFWTAITFDIIESFKNGLYFNQNLRQTGFYTNDQEYFAFGLKTSYELKNKVGFTAATFGAFSGNYVAHVATGSIGIYKKW